MLKTSSDLRLQDCLDVMVANKIGVYLDWLALENPTSDRAFQLTLNYKHQRWIAKRGSEYMALNMACMAMRCLSNDAVNTKEVLADSKRITDGLCYVLTHLVKHEGKLDRKLIPLLCALGLGLHVQRVLFVEDALS